MLKPKTMQRQRGSRSSLARTVQAGIWSTCGLLLVVVFFAYPPQQTVVQETVTIKARILETTLDGATLLASTAEQHSTKLTTAELSDTSLSDWIPPRKDKRQAGSRTGEAAAGAAAAAGTGVAAQAAAGQPDGRVVSSGKTYAVPASHGLPIKYYFKMQNVRLTRQALSFYHDPGFERPKDVWVDFVSGNLTEPRLPTMIVVKGDVKGTLWHYLPVDYLDAQEHQPKCKGWIEKPVYLLQARYSYNIWHTWNEGLMGVFQTLREQGYLPLVQVDAEGNMREVTEGMGPACPLVWDAQLNGTRPEEGCTPKTGVVTEPTCDTKNQAWCKEGVVSYSRSSGPIILPWTADSVMNKWAQIYAAMTDDIRDWSLMDGWCFRNLIVGKTSTLNFYQVVNTTTLNIDSHRRERVEAMSVFKRFVTTAQREYVRAQQLANPKDNPKFTGYKNKKLEKLRRGIGPEKMEMAVHVRPKELRLPLLPDELGEIERLLARTGLPLPRHEMLLVPNRDKGGAAATTRRKRHRDLLQEDSLLEAEGDQEAMGYSSGTKQAAVVDVAAAATSALDSEVEADEPMGVAQEAAQLLAQHEAAMLSMPSVLPAAGAYQHEQPRPVVAYMSRNFFSRGVLNEQDILEYVLSRYNVTLRVTTLEEPLLEVMELLAGTDVLIGMHGAGWTNGIFIKHGATCLQMFPYGWRLPDGSTIRGHNYKEIVLASEVQYLEWVNPHWRHAFFRRSDFQKRWNTTYRFHPDPATTPLPKDGWPGNYWIYQNTYVDMESFGPAIDEAMAKAGIVPLPTPLPILRPEQPSAAARL